MDRPRPPTMTASGGSMHFASVIYRLPVPTSLEWQPSFAACLVRCARRRAAESMVGHRMSYSGRTATVETRPIAVIRQFGGNAISDMNSRPKSDFSLRTLRLFLSLGAFACSFATGYRTVELIGAYTGQFTLRPSIRNNRELTGDLDRHRHDNNVNHQH